MTRWRRPLRRTGPGRRGPTPRHHHGDGRPAGKTLLQLPNGDLSRLDQQAARCFGRQAAEERRPVADVRTDVDEGRRRRRERPCDRRLPVAFRVVRPIAEAFTDDHVGRIAKPERATGDRVEAGEPGGDEQANVAKAAQSASTTISSASSTSASPITSGGRKRSMPLAGHVDHEAALERAAPRPAAASMPVGEARRRPSARGRGPRRRRRAPRARRAAARRARARGASSSGSSITSSAASAAAAVIGAAGEGRAVVAAASSTSPSSGRGDARRRPAGRRRAPWPRSSRRGARGSCS